MYKLYAINFVIAPRFEKAHRAFDLVFQCSTLLFINQSTLFLSLNLEAGQKESMLDSPVLFHPSFLPDTIPGPSGSSLCDKKFRPMFTKIT